MKTVVVCRHKLLSRQLEDIKRLGCSNIIQISDTVTIDDLLKMDADAYVVVLPAKMVEELVQRTDRPVYTFEMIHLYRDKVKEEEVDSLVEELKQKFNFDETRDNILVGVDFNNQELRNVSYLRYNGLIKHEKSIKIPLSLWKQIVDIIKEHKPELIDKINEVIK